MASSDYTLFVKGTYDGSEFNPKIKKSEDAVSSFKTKCEGIGSKVSSALGGIASVGAKVAGVLSILAGGAFAKGGIDRALNIEQAQFKLKQMGMDVEKVMASCNTAVTGTAFSLASAATSASMLGSSGVQAGEQMTRSLQASSGIAAMAGRSMEDVSRVFSKVAAQGRVQGDEMMQLSEMGINAFDALAKHLGMTQSEVRELVSKGKVDFQTFSDAMYATFGEAAYGANDTFQGAMSNVMAALSRVSEKFASPALQGLKSVFQSAIPAINAFSEAIDPVAEKFAGLASALSAQVVNGINAFTDTLKNTGNVMAAFKAGLLGTFEDTAIGSLIEKITGFIAAVKMGTSPITLLQNYWAEFVRSVEGTEAFQKVSKVLEKLPQPVKDLLEVIQNGGGQVIAFAALFAGAFSALGAPIQTAVTAVSALFEKGALLGVLSPMISALGSAAGFIASPMGAAVLAITGMIAAVSVLVATNDEFRSTVAGLVGEIGNGLSPIVGSVGSALSDLGASVLPMLTEAGSMLIETLGSLAVTVLEIGAVMAPLIAELVGTVAPMLAWFVSKVVELVTSVITLVLPVIDSLLAAIQENMPIIQAVMETAMGAVLAVINAVWPTIQAIVETAITVIKDVVSIAMALISGDWGAVWSGIQALVGDVWNGITSIVSASTSGVISLVEAALGFISGIWSDAWDSITSFLNDAWGNISEGVSSGIDDVMSFIDSIPEKIKAALNGLGDLLIDAGQAVMDGFLSGITSGAQSVFDFVSGIADRIASLKGPREYDLKLLIPNGGWIMESLEEGLKLGMPGLERTLGEITDSISSWSFDSEIGYAGSVDYSVSNVFEDFYSGDAATVEELRALREDLAELGIYLDGDVLVGGTVSRMDDRMGVRNSLSRRGVLR